MAKTTTNDKELQMYNLSALDLRPEGGAGIFYIRLILSSPPNEFVI
jgi:hypothetical protein